MTGPERPIRWPAIAAVARVRCTRAGHDPHPHRDCRNILFRKALALAGPVVVTRIPLVEGDKPFTCPHGVDFWVTVVR